MTGFVTALWMWKTWDCLGLKKGKKKKKISQWDNGEGFSVDFRCCTEQWGSPRCIIPT